MSEILNKHDIQIIYNIDDKMNSRLKKSRYMHSQGVSDTAVCLAMKYGESIYKAKIAGLLHDCAKNLSSDQLLSRCEQHKLNVTDVERRNPFLLHSKYGAYLAKSKYGIEDEDILNSIRWHTTGRENMSLLEKIIFISDYIEPYRNQVERLPELRKVAFEDIDKALVMILEETLAYLRSNGQEIDEQTQITYNYYCERN